MLPRLTSWFGFTKLGYLAHYGVLILPLAPRHALVVLFVARRHHAAAVLAAEPPGELRASERV